MNLNERVYDPVKRMADTESQAIDAASVSRVISCLASKWASQPTHEVLAEVAELIERQINEE